MSTNRYYFSNFIEDDTLSIIAITAKEMLQQIDDIVKIYHKNNELLYGQSPRQILFLMKQNNKPLYSSSQSASSGNNSCVENSNQEPSTPVSRNSAISNLKRTLLPNLPLDDAEKKASHSRTLETGTPVRRQTGKKDAAILNPTVDETDKVNEQFASPASSAGSPGVGNQESPRSAELAIMTESLTMGEKDFSCKNKDTKVLNPTVDETSKVDEHFTRPVGSTGSLEEGNQDSPRSTEAVMMTESPSMDKKVGSPVTKAGNSDTDNQESPRSAEIIRMTVSLTMHEKDTSPVLATADGGFNARNQGSPLSPEIIIKTSDLILDGKESRTLVVEERIDTNTDFLVLKGKSGKSPNPDSINKDSINPAEETFKIPKPINVRNETPSPVKRLRMSSISEHLQSKRLSRDRENRLIQKDLMTANSAIDADSLDPGKSAEESTNSDLNYEDSINSAEGEFQILNPTKVGNETSSPVKSVKKLTVEDRMAANTDIFKPAEKSDNVDSNNKDSTNPAEGMVKIRNSIKVRNETPSPVKRSKMCGISAVDIQEFASPAEKVRLADSYPEDSKVSVGPIQGDKMHGSPNEASPGITVDEIKRKSPSPKRKNAIIFRSIPRVIQSAGEAEMNVEVPYDSEDNPSPSTSRILSTSNSPTNKSPVMSESKSDNSPKTAKLILSPSERMISISPSTSRIVSTLNSPTNKSPVMSESKSDDSPKTARRILSPSERMISINPSTSRIASTSNSPTNKSPVMSESNSDDSPQTAKRILSPSERMISISPSTSRIASTSNSPTNKSSVMSESKSDDSPKTARRILSRSERTLSISSSRNVSRTSSSGSDDETAFIRNYPLHVSSIVATATGDRSCKSESTVTCNETEYFELLHTIMKFNTLCSLRHEVVGKIFNSLLYFHNNIWFLNSYARNVGCIVQKISLPGKQYYTKELKDTANDATAIVSKLTKKLTSWKTDIDLDVNTWHKSLGQIEQLKTNYGPLMSDDGKPLMTMETLQVYEYELKAIWKKMDDMIIMGDTRRSLFSQTAHDYEKLIKMFVKCLIMVGMLQPH